MKNNQRGFVIPALIAVVVVVALGAYIYSRPKVIEAPTTGTATINPSEETLPAAAHVNASDNSEVNTGAIVKAEQTDPKALTESEILKATYKISANFDGKKSPAQTFVFPSPGGRTDYLSGIVYMNSAGDTFKSPNGENLEGFWIRKYQYANDSHTEASVYISGNFGASGSDNRVFIVRKADGKVTTQEIACTKTPNGDCVVAQ